MNYHIDAISPCPYRLYEPKMMSRLPTEAAQRWAEFLVRVEIIKKQGIIVTLVPLSFDHERQSDHIFNHSDRFNLNPERKPQLLVEIRTDKKTFVFVDEPIVLVSVNVGEAQKQDIGRLLASQPGFEWDLNGMHINLI